MTTQSTSSPSLADLSQVMGLTLRPGDPAYSASVEDTPPGAEQTNESAELDLDEFIDQTPEDPEQHRSRPAFYNSGWAKALLVGGASLGVCLVGATTFKLMAPGAKVSKEPEPETEPDADPSQTALEQARASASQTKAQLALQTQQRQMNQAAEFSDPEKPPALNNGQPIQTKQAQAVKSTSSTVTPVATKSPPPPARVIRPASSPSPSAAPVSKPRVRPAVVRPAVVRPTPAVIRPAAIAPSPVQPDIDPMAEWQRLATLGRYGTVPPSIAASPPQFTEVADAPVQAALESAESSSSPSTAQPSIPAPPASPVEAVPVASVFEPAPGLGDGSGDVFEPEPLDVSASLVASRTNSAKQEVGKTAQSRPLPKPAIQSSSLTVGTSAAAGTVTPILWAPDAGSSEAHFVISLSEPLTNQQGVQVLPSGTQLIVQATGIDARSGLADLTVVSALVGGQELVPPSGALAIRDSAGGLLMGQDVHSRGSSASHDVWRVAAGALGQAGRLMNQPRRTSRNSIATTGGSSVSETVERDAPNYLGAALEGGFDALSDVMDARQQAAVQKLADAPQLYHLPAGHSVRVFVNQSFSF